MKKILATLILLSLTAIGFSIQPPYPVMDRSKSVNPATLNKIVNDIYEKFDTFGKLDMANTWTQPQTISTMTVLNNIILPTTTRYYSIPPSSFRAAGNVFLVVVSRTEMVADGTSPSTAYSRVELPQGAIITTLVAWWNRNDAAATGTCILFRANSGSLHGTLATANSNSSTGYHTVSTPLSSVVDNLTYTYGIECTLDPNDSTADVSLIGVIIVYTITAPLP